MCGIVGIVGPQCTSRPVFEAMLRACIHRGSDETSSLTNIGGSATLGIQRLSIQDQSHGHQPVVDIDNNITAVCNGEIYNHKAIRSEADTSVVFRSGSDTEVIPYLYQKHGIQCLQHLDGMFALILYDAKRNAFLAARDRYGIKPLYYSVDYHDNSWFFASELKSFAAADIEPRGIRELPAGYYITEEGIPRQWYFLPVPSLSTLVQRPNPSELRLLLEQSVSKHLQRDKNIKIGIFLSGGLDSSIIAALAAQHVKHLVAFTIGVKNSPDLCAARRVAAHLSIKLVECDYNTREVLSHLEKTVGMVESYNTCLVLEGYLTSILAKEARKHGVKVILSGEGADEIFGGYGFFHPLDELSFQSRRLQSLAHIGTTECKRLDRATMAYSVEARVPFLDQHIVTWALCHSKSTFIQQRPSDGQFLDKLVLRQAVEDLLPREITWRTKLAFDTGSGIIVCLDSISDLIDERHARMLQKSFGEIAIQDRVSAHLFRIFHSKFGLVGGKDHFFAMAGNYPIMQPFLHIEEYKHGGTGEVNAKGTLERSIIARGQI